MKKPSRVFNKRSEVFRDWLDEAFDRAWDEASRPAYYELELAFGADFFLLATATRRSQNFFLTTPQKLIQSPTHERKI